MMSWALRVETIEKCMKMFMFAWEKCEMCSEKLALIYNPPSGI